MSIVVIGLSHHSAAVTLRERFAFKPEDVPGALKSLRDSGAAEEAVILSTCNRVEIYAASAMEPRQSMEAVKQFLVQYRGCRDPLHTELYALSEPLSLQHLFKVACGLDSLVLGETEILGQLKDAYRTALDGGHTAGRLNRAFQQAFNTAKHIRTHTNIQRGSTSVGSVAAELAEKIFTSLQDREVLVLGAGDTSEKSARALLARGAHLLVSNRTPERAVALATELGGRAVPFADWVTECSRIDIVLSSTAAPHFVLTRSKLEPLMKLRRNRPLLLIDIAVPRDIEPDIALMENVYLYNIDDLQAIADDYLQLRKEEIARCESYIRDRAEALRRRPNFQAQSGKVRPALP